jgi:membrane protein
MSRYAGIVKQTFQEFGQDKVPRLGAALAYYTIFSVGPLLLIAVAMAGIFFGQQAAQGQVSQELGKVFGSQMAQALEQVVQAAAEPKSGMIATIVGVVTLLFAASGVFGQLKDALNTIWNVETKKGAGIKGFIKDRFLSMAMVLGIGFLLLVTLVFDALISAMGGYLTEIVGGEALMHAVQLTISFALATVLFAAIFRILPDLKIAWRDVWLGAAITSLLFVVGKFALGMYLGKAAVGSSYGAAGSLVVLLVWVYWSAQILLLGAEFTQVYARTAGSLQGDDSKQQARAGAARPEDRPRADAEHGLRPDAAPPKPVPAPMYGKPRASGGFAKIAIGGLAGLVFGALLGGISTAGVLFKAVRRVFVPFK